MQRHKIFLVLLLLSLLPAYASAASVTLGWEYTQAPTHLATGFLIERCQGATCTAFSLLITTPLPIAQLAYTDAQVVAQQTYRWRVYAVDAAGERSESSNILTVLIPLPQVAVGVPQNLRGTVQP